MSEIEQQPVVSAAMHDSDEDDSLSLGALADAAAAKKPRKRKAVAREQEEEEEEDDLRLHKQGLQQKRLEEFAFVASLEGNKVILKIMEAIRDLVVEANLDVTPDGVTLQAMDSSHVSLVKLTLPKEWWGTYHCTHNLSLGLNLMNLNKILKMGRADDRVTLAAQRQGDEFAVMFDDRRSKGGGRFNMKLMDIDAEHLEIPDTLYDMVVRMRAEEFKRLCTELNIIGDTVKLTGTLADERLRFSVAGDLGLGNIDCVAGSDFEIAFNEREQFSQRYGLRYLIAFCKATPLAEKVVLKFADEKPLCVQFDLGNGGEIQYYLAGKIDTESFE